MELLFGLAPSGVYLATDVTISAVRSYRTISPLPNYEFGGIFSVALAVSSRSPGITWHPALWSPDFPLCSSQSDYLANSNLQTNMIYWHVLERCKFISHFVTLILVDITDCEQAQ